MSNVAKAHPSKSFFVEMLTRDIELQDAILDLLDNCIDGIQRQIKTTKAASEEKPYAGFFAKLTLSKKGFEIIDNCGGIPRKKAEEYAFRLGRPAEMPLEQLPTVGVYGIGMKRAIFKMGRSASVTTVNERKAYCVSISPEWMKKDDDWDLPLSETKISDAPSDIRKAGGTAINISHLVPGVASEFDKQNSRFIDILSATIATHYSYILHKGFSIWVNETKIRPKALGVLVSSEKPRSARIEPFLYEAEQNGVKVEVVVGLYRDIPGQKEIDDELDGKSSASRETCGWTIICNDRVVVYADKGRLTGWGEATVPAYHPQFNAIAGIVRFQSSDMSKLPVTTTKRGLEASSDLFLTVKDVMREGLKLFTNFTNHWKGRGNERNAILEKAESVDPFRAATLVKATDWSSVRKGLHGRKYVPTLPRPIDINTTSEVVIKFSRPAEKVAAVADFFLDDSRASPSSVGEYLFDQAYSRASK